MLKRKSLYTVLGAVGALVLLLGGLLGASVVSAQEVTPESEDAPIGGIWGWGRGLFGFGPGGDWTMFDTVADVLGLTPEELFGELHGGATLEDVAEARDVDMEEIQEALQAAQENAQREAIERAVEDGDMSQEQTDWMLEGLEEGYMPRGRRFGRGFGRGGRGPGMRGGLDRFGPEPEPSDTRAPASPSSSSL